jgi:hypothetical protein
MNRKPPTEKAAGPDSFSGEECSSGFLPEESEKKRLFFVLLAWQNSSILRVNLMGSRRT